MAVKRKEIKRYQIYLLNDWGNNSVMNDYKVTLLKGDGIGPEIINEAAKVLDNVSEKYKFHITYENADLGGVAIEKHGIPLPDETINKCKNADSILLGAVGGPKWDNLEEIYALRLVC